MQNSLIGDAKELRLGDMTFAELDAEIQARIDFIKRERKRSESRGRISNTTRTVIASGSRTVTAATMPSGRALLVQRELRRYYEELERRLELGMLDDVATEPVEHAAAGQAARQVAEGA